MTSSVRLVLGLAVALALFAGSGGASSPPSTATSPGSSPGSSLASQASPSTTVSANGNLDPPAQMPAGFPADVPVYPAARLTTGGNFTSNGTTTWGMNWETTDSTDKVDAFYAAQLSQGDWTTTGSFTSNGVYEATFSQKGTTKVAGVLEVDGNSGFTKVALALTITA